MSNIPHSPSNRFKKAAKARPGPIHDEDEDDGAFAGNDAGNGSSGDQGHHHASCADSDKHHDAGCEETFGGDGDADDEDEDAAEEDEDMKLKKREKTMMNMVIMIATITMMLMMATAAVLLLTSLVIMLFMVEVRSI